jgi:hypothetical protein
MLTPQKVLIACIFGSFGLKGLPGQRWHLNTPAARKWVNVILPLPSQAPKWLYLKRIPHQNSPQILCLLSCLHCLINYKILHFDDNDHVDGVKLRLELSRQWAYYSSPR